MSSYKYTHKLKHILGGITKTFPYTNKTSSVYS